MKGEKKHNSRTSEKFKCMNCKMCTYDGQAYRRFEGKCLNCGSEMTNVYEEK